MELSRQNGRRRLSWRRAQRDRQESRERTHSRVMQTHRVRKHTVPTHAGSDDWPRSGNRLASPCVLAVRGSPKINHEGSGDLMTLQQLEAHLWGAANILRGKTAGQDYKNYILSLMFYKRLCDQWENEADEAIAEQETAAGPHIHRAAEGDLPRARRAPVQNPRRRRWGDVMAASTNIGEKLTEAMRAVANANEELRGVFTVDWNQPAPDGSGKPLIPNEVVHALIQHFDEHRPVEQERAVRRPRPRLRVPDQAVRRRRRREGRRVLHAAGSRGHARSHPGAEAGRHHLRSDLRLAAECWSTPPITSASTVITPRPRGTSARR